MTVRALRFFMFCFVTLHGREKFFSYSAFLPIKVYMLVLVKLPFFRCMPKLKNFLDFQKIHGQLKTGDVFILKKYIDIGSL